MFRTFIPSHFFVFYDKTPPLDSLCTDDTRVSRCDLGVSLPLIGRRDYGEVVGRRRRWRWTDAEGPTEVVDTSAKRNPVYITPLTTRPTFPSRCSRSTPVRTVTSPTSGTT